MEQFLQIPSIESKNRISNIQQLLINQSIDAALVSDNANKFYLSGRVFNGYVFIPAQGDAIFFVRRPVELSGDNLVYINKPENIADTLIQKGIDAIIVNGTTGESATLSDEEQYNIICCAKDVINHRVPLIAGAGSNNTHHAAKLALNARNAGADAVLSVTPYYSTILSDVFSMCQLHILLLYHSVMHGRINFLVAEQLLHLLNWHPFINSRCCKCPSELMRMHLRYG